jgi:hypothetical protein
MTVVTFVLSSTIALAGAPEPQSAEPSNFSSVNRIAFSQAASSGGAPAEPLPEAVSWVESFGDSYGLASLARAGKIIAPPPTPLHEYSTTEVLIKQGQSLILVMVLVGAAMVKSDLERAHITHERVNAASIAAHSLKAAQTLVDSGTTWMSLFGSGTSAVAFGKPILVLQHLLTNEAARPMFAHVLARGISSLLGNVSWDLGSQLYINATALIANREDSERAQKLLPILIDSFRERTGNRSAVNERDWRILQEVTHNIVRTLTNDDDLRNLWFYNTWRMQIATGDFVTSVTSMLSVSLIGTIAVPGAGTLAAFMFGVAGGVISLMVPQEGKNVMTAGIEELRREFFAVGNDRVKFMNFKRDVISTMNRFVSKGQELPPLLVFKLNPEPSQKMVSITFERIFHLDSRIRAFVLLRDYAIKGHEEKRLLNYSLKISQLRGALSHELDVLDSVYRDDCQQTEALLREFPALADAKNIERYPQLAEIHRYILKTTMLAQILHHFSTVIAADINSDNPRYSAAIQRIYFFGFTEANALSVPVNF